VGLGVVGRYWLQRRRLQEKPQRQFRTVFADNSDNPFEHLPLKDEPNGSSSAFVLHPYVHEILAVKEADTTPNAPVLHDTDTAVPWFWVDTESQLHELIETLKSLECFALDTEFHKHRSYHGFTCLIQIFTGQCIYLIDAILLHDELHALNDVLSDPKIRKILHGCHNDVIWLQQDFKIYLVNVFDTEKACQVLKKPKSNLAYLLEEYFGIKTDKSMQQADWRRRPLTEDQIEYAKLDVRYLLRLESILKLELLEEQDLYTKAVDKSHDMTLSLFQKFTSKESATSAAIHLIRRYFDMAGKSLNQDDYDILQESPFMSCVYRLCVWRDEVARIEDESPEYILKNKLMSLIAREMPSTTAELLDCVQESPLYDYTSTENTAIYWKPPKAFVKRAKEVVDIIAEVSNGWYVWSEGPVLLDPTRKQGRLKSKQMSNAARERTVGIYSAKSKVYDNCKMLSVDGELLCYCDRRNLEWYVKKKIAKVESTDPFVIRLLFQHRTADEANGSHDFYVQSRVNCCVSCGDESHYLRYKIIPACYRKHFPIPLKSHRSHDVVLLCIDCHHIAQTAADRLKRKLAEEYESPLTLAMTGSEHDKDRTVHPTKVRAAALALQNSREKIPIEKLHQLEKTIHMYFGRDPKQHGELSPEDLRLALLVGLSKRDLKKTIKQEAGSGLEIELSSLAKNSLDSGEQMHGEQVVTKAMQNGGEAELYTIIRRFREVFVQALHPKYLPKKWNIDHFAPREFGEHSIFYQEKHESEHDRESVPS